MFDRMLLKRMPIGPVCWSASLRAGLPLLVSDTASVPAGGNTVVPSKPILPPILVPSELVDVRGRQLSPLYPPAGTVNLDLWSILRSARRWCNIL
jgi:hypothetical protein